MVQDSNVTNLLALVGPTPWTSDQNLDVSVLPTRPNLALIFSK